ncbi:hypothetical protein EV174_006340, partial [Coemansia sp. RSA 2320]
SQGISTFSPGSIPSDTELPILNYARLKTTADIAAAMDAAAAGDKNALRAIQATSLLSDIDDVPTEPADPRIEFSNHRPSSLPSSFSAGALSAPSSPRVSPGVGGAVISPRTLLLPATAFTPPALDGIGLTLPVRHGSVKLSRNVRDRLLKARMKQLDKHKNDTGAGKGPEQEPEEEPEQP